MEIGIALPYFLGVVAIEIEIFGSSSTTVANFIYFTYISWLGGHADSKDFPGHLYPSLLSMSLDMSSKLHSVSA